MGWGFWEDIKILDTESFDERVPLPISPTSNGNGSGCEWGVTVIFEIVILCGEVRGDGL